MEDLMYLEHLHARAEEKVRVAERDAREQRAIRDTLAQQIAALKAVTENRPHPRAKFAIGQKVRFTAHARGVTDWYGKPKGWRVTKDVLTVTGYTAEEGAHASWDTVSLSDGINYSGRWLEDVL